MSRKQSRRKLAFNGARTCRCLKDEEKHAGSEANNGKYKTACALAASPEAVNVLIEKHFMAIGEIAVKHCSNASLDPQRTKELNPDDVVREVCEKLTRNWAKVPVEPRFIKYVEALITASPLAGSLEAVECLIRKHYEAIRRIAEKQSTAANVELAHVEGFNADDITQDACILMLARWSYVPVEPGFFKFAKTLIRRRIAELWKKHQRRTNVFAVYEMEVQNA